MCWQTAERILQVSFQNALLLFGYKISNNLRTTAYQPQTNRQAERLNKMIFAQQLHYVAEHQLIEETDV